MLKKTLIFLIIFFVTAASVSGLERRRDQFTTDFGYLLAPIPYILPGAGAGFGLLGAFNNIPFGSTETTIDLFVVVRFVVQSGFFRERLPSVTWLYKLKV